MWLRHLQALKDASLWQIRKFFWQVMFHYSAEEWKIGGICKFLLFSKPGFAFFLQKFASTKLCFRRKTFKTLKMFFWCFEIWLKTILSRLLRILKTWLNLINLTTLLCQGIFYLLSLSLVKYQGCHFLRSISCFSR